jgi:hypothetical protein
MELRNLILIIVFLFICFGWVWWHSYNRLRKKEKLIRKLFDRCHNLEAENIELKNFKDSN